MSYSEGLSGFNWFSIRESTISVVSNDVDNDEYGDYNDDRGDDDNEDAREGYGMSENH